MNPKRLKDARKKAGLTQEKLAEYLDIDGVGASTRIANYESGRYEPPFEMMKKVAKLLDVPEYYFYIVNDEEASQLLERFRGELGKNLSRESVNLLKEIENKLKKINDNLS